jgi:hypothetical protein
MQMFIFDFKLAVKKIVKMNTINFLNYALILRRSVVFCTTSYESHTFFHELGV